MASLAMDDDAAVRCYKFFHGYSCACKSRGWSLENFRYERKAQAKIARKTLENLREMRSMLSN